MSINIEVRYDGPKAFWRDNLYGTGKTWGFNESHLVPVSAAILILKHPEFTRLGDTSAPLKDLLVASPTVAPLANEREKVEEPPLINLDVLSKAKLAEYAKSNFGVELDIGAKKADLIDQVRAQMRRRQEF